MSDDRKQMVYHVTCALELATELLIDLATFFHPPAPYPQLFVLTKLGSASPMMERSEQVQTEGDSYAVSKPSAD